MGEPIFAASSQHALTSLCEVRPGRARVWACSACGHLRGEELPDTGAYYESDYRILLNHDDEDQIYEVRGDAPRRRYRSARSLPRSATYAATMR